MKTRILALVLALMMLVSAAACSKKTDDVSSEPELVSPEQVLTDFMKAMTAADYDKAGELTTDPEAFVEDMEELESEDEDEYTAMGMDIVKEILKAAKVSDIKDVKIDGDTATLKAKVTAVDFASIMTDVQDKFANMSEEDAAAYLDKLEDPTDIEALTKLMMDDMMKDLKDAMSASDAKTKEETVTVTFKKGETSWLIDYEENDDLFSAMIAGLDKM